MWYNLEKLFTGSLGCKIVCKRKLLFDHRHPCIGHKSLKRFVRKQVLEFVYVYLSSQMIAVALLQEIKSLSYFFPLTIALQFIAFWLFVELFTLSQKHKLDRSATWITDIRKYAWYIPGEGPEKLNASDYASDADLQSYSFNIKKYQILFFKTLLDTIWFWLSIRVCFTRWQEQNKSPRILVQRLDHGKAQFIILRLIIKSSAYYQRTQCAPSLMCITFYGGYSWMIRLFITFLGYFWRSWD